MGSSPSHPGRPMDADVKVVWRLRLIIARAAQSDSLGWWDDRSLTAEGEFLATRLFARRPRLAAAKIALAAARARHAAAIPKGSGVHLFDLGGELEYELAGMALDEAWIPVDPIVSSDALLDALAGAIPDGVGYTIAHSGRPETLTGPIEIRPSPDVDPSVDPMVAKASALALAYGGAGLGRPVFPFLKG